MNQLSTILIAGLFLTLGLASFQLYESNKLNDKYRKTLHNSITVMCKITPIKECGEYFKKMEELNQ